MELEAVRLVCGVPHGINKLSSAKWEGTNDLRDFQVQEGLTLWVFFFFRFKGD